MLFSSSLAQVATLVLLFIAVEANPSRPPKPWKPPKPKGPVASVGACINATTAPQKPLKITVTPGAKMDPCMGPSGTRRKWTIDKAGMHCNMVATIESRIESVDSDKCDIKPSHWTLGFKADNDLESFTMAQMSVGGDNKTSKADPQVKLLPHVSSDFHICGWDDNLDVCDKTEVTWKKGLVGDVWLIWTIRPDEPAWSGSPSSKSNPK